MGYCGGKSAGATYESVCSGDGHTEAIKVSFDPQLLKYDDVLDIFWQKHNPCGSAKPQYMSAIFCASGEQETAALASLKVEQARRGSQRITTKVLPFDAAFWSDAEEYHQDYFRKNRY